jgi:hypothetical protein
MLGFLFQLTPSYRQRGAQVNGKSANQCGKIPIFSDVLQSALVAVGCQAVPRI